MLRDPTLLAGIVTAALLAAGCGEDTPPTQAAPSAQPAAIQLPVLLEATAEPGPWEIDVPVAAGWKSVVEPGQPIAAITRPFGRNCILLVQVAATGTTGKPPEPTQRGLRKTEKGSRSLVVDGPEGEVRFAVRFKLGEARRLVFSGGATGPGGRADVVFEPAGSVPWLNLTAQGGTEGPGCLSRSVESAPATVLKALRLIARDATVRYTR